MLSNSGTWIWCGLHMSCKSLFWRRRECIASFMWLQSYRCYTWIYIGLATAEFHIYLLLKKKIQDTWLVAPCIFYTSPYIINIYIFQPIQEALGHCGMSKLRHILTTVVLYHSYHRKTPRHMSANKTFLMYKTCVKEEYCSINKTFCMGMMVEMIHNFFDFYFIFWLSYGIEVQAYVICSVHREKRNDMRLCYVSC